MVILHCVFLITRSEFTRCDLRRPAYKSLLGRASDACCESCRCPAYFPEPKSNFEELNVVFRKISYLLKRSIFPKDCVPTVKYKGTHFSTVDISKIYRRPTEFWLKTYAGGSLLRTLNFWSESEITNIGSTIFCLEMAFWGEVSAPL